MAKQSRDLLPLAVLFGLLAVVYGPTVVWMADRWTAAGSYFSHGYLIAPVALGWIWMRRDRLRLAEVSPDARGFALAGAGLLLHAVSQALGVHFPSGYSMVVVAAGLVLALFGRAILRVVAAPVAFLAFMVPIPLVAVAHLTLKLKLLASSTAVAALGVVGVPVEQQGSLLYVGSETLMVGDACSGLRSLIALLALGFLVVQRVPGGMIPQAALYTLVLPLAVLGNVLRVFVLCLVAHWIGAERLSGLIHDGTGLLIYAVTLCGLFVAVQWVERRMEGAPA